MLQVRVMRRLLPVSVDCTSCKEKKKEKKRREKRERGEGEFTISFHSEMERKINKFKKTHTHTHTLQRTSTPPSWLVGSRRVRVWKGTKERKTERKKSVRKKPEM